MSLVTVPYVLIAQVIFFRAQRCFVKLHGHVVGVLVLRDKADDLFVVSLGVAREYRRIGVAVHVLRYSERLAAGLGKEWLELTVLKRNSPAQRLYVKFGFKVKKVGRWSLVLRKKVEIT